MTLSSNVKIFLKLLALLAVIALVGVAIFMVFFRGGPQITPTTPTEEEVTPGVLPSGQPSVPTPTVTPEEVVELPISSVAAGGPTLTAQLTASPITAPTLTSGSQIAYYDQRDGKFYSIDKNGNVVSLSSATYPAAQSVTFSSDAKKAAIEFPDGSNIIYDLATETQTTLPSYWQDFSFSSDGAQIASKSIGTDVNNRALVISNADGSRTSAIAALGNNADDVTINFSPDNNIVAFSETGTMQTSFGRNEVYLIDTSGKVADTLIVDGANFSALWAPNGQDILYSVADSAAKDRPALWYAKVLGAGGGARKNLNLETWVEKCVFADSVTIICAVPQNMVDEGGFDHRLVTGPDNLYKINLVTGKKTLLASLVVDMQMSNLKLSDDGSTLYFTDQINRLNSIRLK